MTISDAGIELIKEMEGIRLSAYKDVAGYATIGIGHLIKPGEKFGKSITEEQAEDLLREDLKPVENAIRELVNVPLTQSQYDVLCSFIFNEGIGHFKASTLLEKLNRGDYDAIPTELEKWTWAGGKVCLGLVNRRAAEAELWEA